MPATARLLPLFTALAAPLIAAPPAEPTRLERSDIILMGSAKPEVYDALGATVVSWGGKPWKDTDQAREQFAARVRDAADRGIRYLPGAAFRTAFAGMIDFDPNFLDAVCRDLAGEPILVPWLWDHKHKDHPAYWFCSNAPRYREYLKTQIRSAFVPGAVGLHIDDYAGTQGTHYHAGCFCNHCMAGFRGYLKEHGGADALRRLEAGALATFDYGAFLRAKGITPERFRGGIGAWPEKIPLGQAFLAFQVNAATTWVAEYRKWAEGVAGRPLALCVNSAATRPDNLAIAPVVTFFSGEVPHEGPKGALSFQPVWTFLLGDALDRPAACTASGDDWAFVNANAKPGLVRAWIAQAYAFGSHFMPPVRQWCYTKEKGTHWWEPPAAEFAPLCRFIRASAPLLDGYASRARVGLLYSNAALRHNRREAIAASAELARRNIPFHIVIAGDDWLPNRLDDAALAGLDALVVAGPHDLDPAQEAVLKANDRVVVSPLDPARLAALAPPLMQIAGDAAVTLLPRAKPGDPSAPKVCHLLNRNYLLPSDAMQPVRNLALTISDRQFDAPVTRARLHAPGRQPRALNVRRTAGSAALTVPEIELWAILELNGAVTPPPAP